MNNENLDLTRGPLGRQIVFFSLPLILSNLLQVLFNVADIAVVGRFAGSMALGSVGSTTIMVSLFTGFMIGMSAGINVLVALYFGAKDEKSIEETVHTALLLSLMLGGILLLLGLASSRFVLELLNTKPELIDGAILYMRIYFLGMPALAVYNFGNAVFSAVGDTKRPLRYLSLAGVVNILLNLFLVIVCNMSVAGVAIASIISQYISAVLITRALFKSEGIYGLRLSCMRITRGKAKNILVIGVPSGIQNAIFHVANLFVQAGVNSFSAVVVAGNSAAVNADALVYDVMTAFYTACGSFMGQNYGARNKKRIRNSYFICLAYAFVSGLILGLLLFVFGRQFLSLFTPDIEVVDAGMIRVSIMGLCYAFSSFMDCTIVASRALGKNVVPMIIIIMGSCIFRVIWIYTVFAYFHTITSLYMLYICSWAFTGTAEVLYFRYIYKQKMAEL